MDSLTETRISKMKTCCCGCKLEAASKAVGYIEAIICPIPLLFFLILAIVKGIHRDEGFPIEKELILLCWFESLHGFLAVYLLVGLYKKKPHYLKVWVVFHVFSLLVALICLVVWCVLLMLWFPDYNLILYETIISGIKIYFIRIVYSYYFELKIALEVV